MYPVGEKGGEDIYIYTRVTYVLDLLIPWNLFLEYGEKTIFPTWRIVARNIIHDNYDKS